MRAHRKDVNHADVGSYLRALGWNALDLAQHGMSIDWLVSRMLEDGRFVCALVEVKKPGPAHCRKLTEREQKLKDDWQGLYIIAQSGEEAATELLILMRGW